MTAAGDGRAYRGLRLRRGYGSELSPRLERFEAVAGAVRAVLAHAGPGVAATRPRSCTGSLVASAECQAFQ